jgi:flagellar biosynthesis/type III secretory pathway protein FliH
MKVRLALATCGTCHKQRGIRHTCVTNAASKRRKTRTSVRPRLKVACGKCGKDRGLRHTCHIKTDFKKRLRQQAAAEKKAERKTASAKAKAKRDALRKKLRTEAKAKKKRPRAAPHDPVTCRLPDCERYGCVKYRSGFADGHEEGYDEGVRDCPRPHGGA